MSDAGEVIRDLIRKIDLTGQPGCFRASWCSPTGGSLVSLSGEYTLDMLHDGSGDWVATYTDAGHTWTGRSAWADGAFLAMLADRCGLVAQVDCKPERNNAAEERDGA